MSVSHIMLYRNQLDRALSHEEVHTVQGRAYIIGKSAYISILHYIFVIILFLLQKVMRGRDCLY
jgi:hypothetical protein